MRADVHIVPHPSAAVSFREAFGADKVVFANCDDLSCGPIREFTSIDAWVAVREAYWGSLWDLGDGRFFDHPRDVLVGVETLRDASSIVLWTGSGLDEQLLLVWIPQLLHRLDVPISRLRLVQFEPGPGESVARVARMNPRRLAKHPSPRSLDAAALADLNAAWAAITEGAPTALLSFLSNDSESVPLLRASLRSLMGRFPDAVSGLNEWKERLLALTRRGSRAVAIVGEAMKSNVTPDQVSDLYLFPLLCELAVGEHPLLSRQGLALAEAEFWLTQTGNRVLAGEANLIDVNGIDEWICGVHLDSASGPIWVRRGNQLAVRS